MDLAARPVILFDGSCPLCNGFVRFLLRRDRDGVFDFAPLESPPGRRMVGGRSGDSVVLAESGRHYEAEDAVIRILSRLPAPWRQLARLLAWCPKPILRRGYRLIARYRYAVFGQHEVCPVPPTEWKNRFLS